jgi:hypothetical protein
LGLAAACRSNALTFRRNEATSRRKVSSSWLGGLFESGGTIVPSVAKASAVACGRFGFGFGPGLRLTVGSPCLRWRIRFQLREQFEMDNVTSRPQEFAGGFVDFLLGRGACHPR